MNELPPPDRSHRMEPTKAPSTAPQPPAPDPAEAPTAAVPAARGERKRSVGRRLYELVWRAGPRLADTVLPFVLVLYLALEGGGYDSVVRSEVGIAVWWLLVLGAIVGLLPRGRFGPVGWSMLGVLAVLALWTGLGMIWSESTERSAQELFRVVALLGVFALGLSIQGRDSLRYTAGAIAAAIGVVALLALGSRFQPNLYPADSVAEFLPGERARLNYPVGYWNGLAALVALGLPLLIWLGAGARAIVARALATAVLPALVLTTYLTLSRGGVVEAGAALAVLFALHPRRLTLLAPTILGGLGGGALIALAARRDDLTDGLETDLALTQGDEMLGLTLGICALVGLLAAGIQLALKREKLAIPRVPPRVAAIATGVVAVVAIGGALAAGVPSEASDRWEEFKQPITPADTAERFTSATGSGRYQWWASAVNAGEAEPLLGIGPGTFEYWWARGDTDVPGFVRDAHSLYLETFGELGVPGLLLVLALVGGAVGIGAFRTFASRPDPELRGMLAAVTASLFAFAVAAAIDWAWELTVLPAIFLLLTAAVIGGGDAPPRAATPKSDGRWRRLLPSRAALPRIILAGAGLIAAAMLTTAVLGGKEVRQSQDEVSVGALGDALDSAERAERLQPYAAEPLLQRALVLELAGDLPGAAEAAEDAADKEPTNWRHWFVLARIEAVRGRVGPATQAFREARSLNPRSPLFAG